MSWDKIVSRSRRWLKKLELCHESLFCHNCVGVSGFRHCKVLNVSERRLSKTDSPLSVSPGQKSFGVSYVNSFFSPDLTNLTQLWNRKLTEFGDESFGYWLVAVICNGVRQSAPPPPLLVHFVGCFLVILLDNQHHYQGLLLVIYIWYCWSDLMIYHDSDFIIAVFVFNQFSS